MIKKESLVTKQELEELQNKRNERKKILEEGLTKKKLNLIKMWKHRSENIRTYKHPLVVVLENEKLGIMKTKKKSKNKKKTTTTKKINYNFNLQKLK